MLNTIIDLKLLSVWFIPGLLAITMHEAAHAFMAKKLGDNTANAQGRLTLDPFNHVDVVGTIVVPIVLLIMQSGFLFGWAKPVPVVSSNFKRPKLGLAIVAFCGPLANFIMALGWGLLLKITLMGYLNFLNNIIIIQWLSQVCHIGIQFNIFLLVFNMIPIPPLDGSKCLAYFLPFPYDKRYSDLEDHGMILLMSALWLTPLRRLMMIASSFLLEVIRYAIIF